MAFPLHMCSGFPMEKNRADDCDVIKSCHSDLSCYWAGKYIRKASLSLRAVVWVFGTEWLGQLLSHQPSTLATLVPLMEQEYILDVNCVPCLFICMYPDPFWEPFS